jgi:hypothetical protein
LNISNILQGKRGIKRSAGQAWLETDIEEQDHQFISYADPENSMDSTMFEVAKRKADDEAFKLKTLPDLARAFGWNANWGENLCNSKRRSNTGLKYSSLGARTRNCIANHGCRLLDAYCEIVVPGHKASAKKDILNRLAKTLRPSAGQRTLKSLLIGIRRSKQKSIPQRVMRAVLKNALSRQEIKALGDEVQAAQMVGDSNILDIDDDANDCDEEDQSTDGEDMSLNETLSDNSSGESDGSDSSGFTREIANEFMQAGPNTEPSMHASISNEPNSNQRTSYLNYESTTDIKVKFARRTQTRAIRDWKEIVSGKPLSNYRRSIRRYNELQADRAIMFILSPDNVVPLSWGNKEVKLKDGTSVTIPSITRKKIPEYFYNAYVENMSQDPFGLLSKSSFLRILKTITKGNDKILSAVDYVTGFLINDNFRLIERIIKSFCITTESRKKFLNLMNLSKNFLKNQYNSHIERADSCASHGIIYGLDPSADQTNKNMDCNACKFPFYFLAELRKIVHESDGEPKSRVLEVLNDCEKKMLLYMAHRVRVLNQQRKIEALHEEMKLDCISKKKTEKALLIIDFKMKYESKYYRGKTTEHFGKRGIGWHGIILQYYRYEEVNGEPRAVKVTLNLDQILQGSNKQDGAAVLGLLEAAIYHLKNLIPDVKTLAIQSDNAKCYHSKLMLAFIPILSASCGVHISKYIHTETQDGKGLIDAHFARGSNHVDFFIQEGQDAATPRQVYESLISNGGLSNSGAQLIGINREHLQKFEDELQPLLQKFKRLVPRANEIVFDPVTQGALDISDYCNSNIDCAVTAFDYSGIQQGRKFEFNIRERSFEPVSAFENGQDEATLRSNHMEAPDESSEDTEGEEDFEISDEEDVDASREHANHSHIALVTKTNVLESTQVRRNAGGTSRETTLHNTAQEEISETASDSFSVIDLVSYAAKRVISLLEDVEAPVQIRDGRLECEEYNLASTFEMSTFLPGWARRPRHGEMYGKSYISNYRSDIKCFFQLGVKASSEKMHPAWMREKLEEIYPNAYDLPTEQDIRVEIQRLFNLQKKGKDLNTLPGKHGSDKKWFVELEEFLETRLNISAKPADLLQSYKNYAKAKHGTLDSFPSDKQLYSKISREKSKLNKNKA